MENDYVQQFNEIVEFNEFEFIDLEDEVEADVEDDSPYNLGEAMELNYMLSTVMQQIAAAQIDMENEEKTGWLDTDSAILLRELYEVCENVIDRTYNCDECDDEDCDDWDGDN